MCKNTAHCTLFYSVGQVIVVGILVGETNLFIVTMETTICCLGNWFVVYCTLL